MNGDGWGSPSRRSNVQIATRKRTTPRSSWTSRTARVWQPHRASFPCSVRRLSPSLSVIPPSSPSRADVSEGCDGNSICLSLTPSPAKACGGATLLPISISLALARRGTKRRRRRQMKYFIQKTPPQPPRALSHSHVPSHLMHNNEARAQPPPPPFSHARNAKRHRLPMFKRSFI